jgi:hypothetical protein
MAFSDEEHREHLLALLKSLYRELVVYRSFVEFVRGIVGNVDVEEILETARHDPELDAAVDSYFRNFSAATPQTLNTALDRAISEFFSKWKPRGKPN